MLSSGEPWERSTTESINMKEDQEKNLGNFKSMRILINLLIFLTQALKQRLTNTGSPRSHWISSDYPQRNHKEQEILKSKAFQR